MAYPKVTITQQIRGPRPVRVPGSFARIGMVGEFYKGEYLKFVLVGSDNDFKTKYDETLHAGSLFVASAMEQGALDFGLVRVMGAARTASATSPAITGSVTSAGNLILSIANTATFVVVNINVPVTLGQSNSAVATAIAAANALSTTTPVTITANPGAVNGALLITAKTPGAAGNNLEAKVFDDPTPTGLTLPGALTTTGVQLSGGVNGPARATITIPDTLAANCLRATAKSEGLWGNSLTVQVIAGTVANTVTVIVNNLTEETEERYENLTFGSADLLAGGRVRRLAGDPDIDLFYISTTNALPVTGATVYTLAAGYDGSTILASDYIEALDVLEDNQAAIIAAGGSTNTSVKQALLSQAVNSEPMVGLRRAVLNGPQVADISTVASTVTGPAVGYDPAEGRAVMVLGWATYSRQPTLAELTLPPDGLYCGLVASIPVEVSPAARSSSKAINSITAVDTISTDQAFNAYTDGRLEAIVLDQDTGSFRCLNGRTLSSDPAHYYWTVGRQDDVLRTTMFRALQFAKAEPKRTGGSLLADIQQTADGQVLQNLAADGTINGGSVAEVVSITGGVRVTYDWDPVYPADAIKIIQRRTAVEA